MVSCPLAEMLCSLFLVEKAKATGKEVRRCRCYERQKANTNNIIIISQKRQNAFLFVCLCDWLISVFIGTRLRKKVSIVSCIHETQALEPEPSLTIFVSFLLPATDWGVPWRRKKSANCSFVCVPRAGHGCQLAGTCQVCLRDLSSVSSWMRAIYCS